MSKPLALFGFIALLLAGGCSVPMVTTTTVLHRDGSFDRRVELSPATNEVVKHTSGQGDRIRPMTRTETKRALAKSFDVSHADGRLVRDRRSNTPQYIWAGHGHYAKSESAIHDVVLKSPTGRDVIANQVSSRSLGDGRWEYVERYHWMGKRLSDKDWITPNMRKRVKATLGPGFDTGQIDKLTTRLTRDVIWEAARPSGALTSASNKQEDAAEKQFATAIQHQLEQQADDDREKGASARLAQLVVEKHAKPIEDDLAGTLAALPNTAVTVTVKVPGKVLTTNATQDKDGLWKWTFWAGAVGTHDVDLRVIYRP